MFLQTSNFKYTIFTNDLSETNRVLDIRRVLGIKVFKEKWPEKPSWVYG